MNDPDEEQIEDEPHDQSLASADDRWFAYKMQCRGDGVEPMSWGEWIRAGQPLRIED